MISCCFLFLSLLLICAGIALIMGSAVAPNKTESIVFGTGATIRNSITQQLDKVQHRLPVVHLNGRGGTWALNRAKHGDFVYMSGYRMSGIVPVYASHNNYGGDIILNWRKGKLVELKGEGRTGVWKVIGVRNIPKYANVSALKVLRGTVALQTCYYGRNVMRYVELVPYSS